MTDVSKEPRTGVDRSISRASNTRPSMNLDSFFSFEKQRVKQGNLSVKKEASTNDLATLR